MSRESIVILLGLVVFFAPHAGVPDQWKLYILNVSGALLVLLGYSLRRSAFRRRMQKANHEMGTDSFMESGAATGQLESQPSS